MVKFMVYYMDGTILKSREVSDWEITSLPSYGIHWVYVVRIERVAQVTM